jgi:hypothetical protein
MTIEQIEKEYALISSYKAIFYMSTSLEEAVKMVKKQITDVKENEFYVSIFNEEEKAILNIYELKINRIIAIIDEE